MATNKYNNKKQIKYGRKWDSTMEMEYYEYLLKLKEDGIVENIECQPEYELQEKFRYKDKAIRPIKYKADFRVTYTDKHIEVIDVKGQILNDFKLKRKMLIHKYRDIDFRCIRSRGRKPNKIWEQVL
ncbi:DUF1064 domain-containing protein [Clostridium perfringens]